MRKLLLADDSATIRKVVQLCFADEPFEFASASAGMEASELLRTWRPDVLLVDVLLPEIDGYQLCRQAKQENGIPVLLLVGTFEPFDFGEAERAGYDTYLTKPFDTLKLVQVVKEATARTASAARAMNPQGATSDPVRPSDGNGFKEREAANPQLAKPVPASSETGPSEHVNKTGTVPPGRADLAVHPEIGQGSWDSDDRLFHRSVATGPVSSHGPALIGGAAFLEMNLVPEPVLPAILEIEEWSLPSWERRTVPEGSSSAGSPAIEPESLEPEPVESASSIELEATAVINRLLPRWVDFMRAELLEELKRQH